MEETEKLKLNVKRTVLVGLAFFTISMFWQIYNNLMPLFLQDFNFNSTITGLIMAMDNILAVVLMPFLGNFSDRFPKKLRGKFGRRMPFIVVGSVLAALTFMLVNYAHNVHNLALMLATTAFVLVFMCAYRSPAVALMPDVTPHPIRSTGNAVINIMGTVGGVITLLLMQVFLVTETGADGVGRIVGNNWALVSIVSGMMILATVVMILKVRENKFAEDAANQLKRAGIAPEEEQSEQPKMSIVQALKTLNKPQLISLVFILLSVFMWYMAYNALETHFSRFSLNVLGEKFTLPLLVANAAAFIMFIPAVEIGRRIGRKKTVMLGVLLMGTGLLFASICLISGMSTRVLKFVMYPTFVLVGGGWATINVHSYIMCVELSTESTTGTYTGMYYAFSMTAQIITPVLAGLVIDYVSPIGLVPYSLVFTAIAFVTMIFVKHGNATPVLQDEKSAETAENEPENTNLQ